MFFYGQIVDALMSLCHEAICIELPVLIAVRAAPPSILTLRLVGETHGDVISVECPKFFDKAIFQLLSPLALQKLDDSLATTEEL